MAATTVHDAAPADVDGAHRWWTLATLCACTSVIVMDNTILNVAIPSLIRELDASNSEVQWIIDSYTLVFAGLLLTTGSLSDRYGRKGALQLGVVVFAVCSALAALATSATQLIVARAVMGIGGALIMPATLSILTNVFRDSKERARAISLWAAAAGLGVALGPVAGGLLLRHFSWSSVFWINVPIGVLAVIGTVAFVPTSRDVSRPRLDPLGSILSIAALGALVFGIIEGPVRGWTGALVVGAFVIGGALAAVFLAWESRSSSAMLDLTAFSNPRFSAAIGAITLSYFALFGALFLMSQYWQFVHGYSALQTGVRMLPFAAVLVLSSSSSARVVEVLGTKRVMTAGLSCSAAAVCALSFVDADTPYGVVIVIYSFVAVGIGMCSAPATESVMGSLPRAKAGVGSAMNDTSRQVGGALGVAIIGSVVASVFASRIGDLAQRLGVAETDGEEAQSSLGAALAVANRLPAAEAFADGARDAFVTAFSAGLRISMAVLLGAALVVWRFLPARGVHADASRATVGLPVADPAGPVR